MPLMSSGHPTILKIFVRTKSSFRNLSQPALHFWPSAIPDSIDWPVVRPPFLRHVVVELFHIPLAIWVHIGTSWDGILAIGRLDRVTPA